MTLQRPWMLPLLTLTFILSITVIAAASPSKKKSSKNSNQPVAEVSLRDKALTESQNLGQQKKQASEVQMESGVLTLKDPRPEVITRSWNYFVGVSAQQFQPEGRVTNDLNNNFDLGQQGQTLMPGVEFGVISQDYYANNILLNFGAQLKGAFSSQAVEVTYPSGAVIDDARLNTSLLSVGPTVAARWERYDWLSLVFTPEFGTLRYTQTSSSSYGQFSKSAAYRALTAGFDFKVGEKVSVFTKYSQRDLDDNQLALQKDNFELGTKLTW